MESQVFPFVDPGGAAAEALQGRVLDAVASGSKVTIDLDGLSNLDAPAIRALILMLRRVREAGGELALAATRPDLRRTIGVTALDRLFSVVGTRA